MNPTPTPTPALRSALLRETEEFLIARCNFGRGKEATALYAEDLLARLTPFLAPAPVEQAASLEKAARSIVNDIETMTRCWIETNEEDKAVEIVKASIQRHFQSLATEKGAQDAAPFRLALRIIAGNTSDPVIKKYAHDILQANAARAATGKGDGK